MISVNQKWYLQHLRNNFMLYLVVLGIFTVGIVFGSMGVKVLHQDQAGQLAQLVNNFVTQLDSLSIDFNGYTQEVVWSNLKILVSIYFLGLTVIGIPVILLIVLIRGFLLGFVVGFLVKEKAVKGFVFVLSSILPQNLINIPVLIIAGVMAVHFSLALVRGGASGGFNQGGRILPKLVKYSVVMLVLSLFSIGSGFIQGYLTPVLMKFMAAYVRI